MTALSDIERHLALRLRIEALMADYVHCIDDDRLEDWPGFFVEHGRYRVTTRENHELGLPVNLIYCDGSVTGFRRCAPPTSSSRTSIATWSAP